ncbi:uncharacterized protein JN550_013038 [Neoarthrinium moseri]|uniref:uncharacterized protein n=1 Tax=Neoarthrinium moseri TaxID=1658444 RepID=UPI001FDCF117|nr:uncharacterized protein JN550_013038 [Neoarthrinium moseri]KAI1857775.1 hypothetical protein JN550_013038 [Neoarthrinium moseri]
MSPSSDNGAPIEPVEQHQEHPQGHQPEHHQLPPQPSPPIMEAKSEQPKAPARPAVQSRKSGMNGPLYMQTSGNKVLIRRVRRKGDGPMKSLSRWFLENQAGLSFNLLALLFLTHFCMSKARPYTAPFFTLSHYNPETGRYAAGKGDFFFVFFCVVLFTGLRAGCMEHVLAPLSKKWGISKKKDITRFAEQAWLLIYYLAFWPLGFVRCRPHPRTDDEEAQLTKKTQYLYYKSDYYFNLNELWTNWPIRELDGTMKAYMLGQWAFWLQQVLVIHIEERRKDHWQMLSHHFVTILLISSCYAYHQTRVGHLILVLMDIVDLFFPLAKCLKYLGYTTLCDVMFGLFVVSWFLARHVFYMMVCWSIYADLPIEVPDACFRGTGHKLSGPLAVPNNWGYLLEPFRDPQGLVCWNSSIRWGFLSCLLFLQVLTLAWFTLIVRMVIRVLKGGNADDPRSDDEAGEDEEESEYEEAHPLEEEVGVEAIDLKNWERRAGVKRTATTSGVNLPGHSDRKELLGRIGCEKQVE